MMTNNPVNGSGLGARTLNASPPLPPRQFAYYGIMTSGQSLSNGTNTTNPPPQDAGTQPYNNLMLNDSLSVRANSTAYALNHPMYLGWNADGYMWTATTAGTTASSSPTFPTSAIPGTTTVNDGSVVWTCYRAQQGPFDWNWSSGPTLSTKALISGTRPINASGPATGQYPNTGWGYNNPYTVTECAANQATAQSYAIEGRNLILCGSNVGTPGAPYSVIMKGGSDNGYIGELNEVQIFKNLLGSFGVAFRHYVHGEADSGNASYGADMLNDWANVNADYSAITGQTNGSIPFIYSQQNSYGGDNTLAYLAVSTIQQWSYCLNNPTKLVCTQPKYHLTYTGSDSLGIHPDNLGYQLMGEKDGYVMFERFRGNQWLPLMATACTLSGTTATVSFNVPHGPLVWDTTAVPIRHQSGTVWSQWALGYGFEGLDSSGNAIAITTSPVISGNQVSITYASAPYTVSYATLQDSTTYACGSSGGRGGNLRDSDPFVGRSGRSNPNWCLAFQFTGL